ncbi:hypothetical protein DKX38_003024 [Salix brachista]|uniref:Uncharacterized protein n=1 Tax=Salix brachista TaxID=2182728 RepID=A0A5N5NRL4_9ROSI|nr:hypothetical protein DKX38_003024 [Salix brachista]
MEGEARKRLKHAQWFDCYVFQMEENEQEIIDGTSLEIVEKDETDTNIVGSEEMELNIAHIFEKIEHFTQMVSELLESGKAMFKEMSNEFEERLISIHKEEMEKWQEEIKVLRLLDASNEEASGILHNARYYKNISEVVCHENRVAIELHMAVMLNSHGFVHISGTKGQVRRKCS